MFEIHLKQKNPIKVIMLKSVLLLCFLCLSWSHSLFAQLYDAVHRPKLTWYELNTPHFRVIYHDGYEDVARRSARLLESAYPKIQPITGGNLSRFPVVINGYNDLSNGYVTTLHFRMEVEAPPIGGKILNPITGGHLENLMAHELVHALQFSVRGGIGLTSFIHLFSPDMGRSLHGLNPPGIHEGLAVHAESHLVREHGGRGNFAPFQNQFYSNFNSNTPWNLGQMLTPSGASRPTDRHYIGGYAFSNWLINTYDQKTIHQSLHTFAKFPLLGYAPHLWYHTGVSPAKLNRKFREHYSTAHSITEDEIIYTPVQNSLSKDPIIHNPRWLDDQHIIYYGRFYNHPSALWIYNKEHRTSTKIFETSIEESFRFAISPDKEKILFSRYQSHLFYHDTFISDVFEIHIARQKQSRITRNQRSHSPVYNSIDTVYALKSYKDTHQILKIVNGKTMKLINVYPDNIVQIAFPKSPESPTAILVNRNGIQGVWFIKNDEDILNISSSDPYISFKDASIFDLSWSDDSRYLLFSSDLSGTMHIYEYDTINKQVSRLTGGPYNTMEASYSPDNSKVAFVVQRDNGRELVVAARADLLNLDMDPSLWKNTFDENQYNIRSGDELLTASMDWKTHKYRNDGNWIKPRTVIPISNPTGSDNSRTYGLSFQSSDVLRKNSYGLDLEVAHNKMFYDFSYLHTGFFPGVYFNAKHTPYNPGKLITGDNFTFRGEEREFGIGSRMRLNFDHPSSQNYLILFPELVRRSSRVSLIDSDNPANNQTTHWFTSNRLRLFTSYAFRIKQTLRAAQPKSGSILFVQGDYDINVSDNIDSPFQGFRIGTYTFLSPISHLNQSLRIGITSVFQNRPGYNTLNIIHEAFNRDDYELIEKDFLIFSGRYTIPIAHPDKGGFLLPGYIERVYGVIFSETISNTNITKSDTIIGFGIRSRFRFFYNSTFDIGVGYAFHTNKNISETFVMNF